MLTSSDDRALAALAESGIGDAIEFKNTYAGRGYKARFEEYKAARAARLQQP